MTWTAAETNKHQDHVIAHVIGATPLNYFIHDETAYVLLDIGFIWNIYLDMEMGLVPQVMAFSELGVDAESFRTMDVECGPIESVEVFEDGQERRLVLNCEHGAWVIETSLERRWTRINAELR
jgi:hypothetical protein